MGETTVEEPKRKRGRPAKNPEEKAAKLAKVSEENDDAPKRGRGRPKGTSKKKSVAAKSPKKASTGGKRGRPKKAESPPAEGTDTE